MKRVKAFFVGIVEFRRSWTWADPDRTDSNPYTAADCAYDWGREMAHRATFRFWDY